MERLRQPVAAGGNGFRLFPRFMGAGDLPLIATGCNHGPPQRLHPTLPLLATAPCRSGHRLQPQGSITLRAEGTDVVRYGLGPRALPFPPSLNAASQNRARTKP